jgi:hypothetical protein
MTNERQMLYLGIPQDPYGYAQSARLEGERQSPLSGNPHNDHAQCTACSAGLTALAPND